MNIVGALTVGIRELEVLFREHQLGHVQYVANEGEPLWAGREREASATPLPGPLP